MRKNSLNFLLLGLFLFCFLPSSFAASIKREVNLANKLYQQKKFDEALKKYDKIISKLPDSDIVNFNRGTILYKKNQYKEAIDFFTKSLTTENKNLEADALYNIGNCKYKLGELSKDKNLTEAINYMQEALSYYKRAMQLNQKDNDSRFNYEFVEKQLQKLLEDSKKPSQKDYNNEKLSGGSKDEKSKDSKEEKEKTANQQEKKEEDLKSKEQYFKDEKTDKDNQNKASVSNQPEKEEASDNLEKENDMLSEKEAKLLLDKYANENPPDYFHKRQTGPKEKILKDW